MISTIPDLWPCQTRSIEQVTNALVDGQKRVCLCLPTGMGKSRVACELIRDWLVVGYKVSLYTNRKMLIDQLSDTLSQFGLSHGMRSATHMETERPSCDNLQVSSIQTEASRVLKKKTWQLHEADRIIVDEAHLNAGAQAKQILDMHVSRGAAYVGLTATPLDIGHLYDNLIIGGTVAEGRECGALVPALHYGPDEPDTSKIKKDTCEYTENDVRKVMQIQTVFGRILEWFNILNPERKPTICFAPGVPESIWLCEEFEKHGITAAHIDGQSCVYKGERYDSERDVRKEILRASKSGEISVLCNRFVLR